MSKRLIDAYALLARLNDAPVKWARAVLDTWTNRPVNYLGVAISDGLHPTKIEVYAGDFIRLTTEEKHE